MKKRLAVGISIPAVILFIGILVALQLPSNLFVTAEALGNLGLLGSRRRIEGLVPAAPGKGVAAGLLIAGGHLWDAEGGLRPNPGLAVAGGRIVGEPLPGAEIIDVSGMTVLPGLIDMHIHSLGGSFADEMMIGNGITTARDLGSHLDGVLARKGESLERRTGPRLLVTGPYLVGEDSVSDQDIGAPDPETAAAIVERFADAGVDGIKVHWGVRAETLSAVVETAHRRGLWVAAHLHLVSAFESARIGVDTIEHGTGLELDRSVPDDEEGSRLIEMMVSQGVAVTPTLVVAEHAFIIEELARAENPYLAYFPWLLRRAWIVSQLANASAAELTGEQIAIRRNRLERTQEFVRRFHAAGGRVLAGTDSPAFLVAPGFDIHRELELLVESGLTPAEALAAATRDAASALGLDAEIGRLRPGMRADLIVVPGNPLTGRDGISATRKVILVVSAGRVMLDRLH